LIFVLSEGAVIEDFGLFFHVVDAGSFTQASRRTGVTKATISRRIRALEARLGVTLLHRNARRLLMTDSGKRVFEHGRTIVAEAEAATAEAQESCGDAGGNLRISCPVVLAEVVVGRLAAEFTKANPRLHIMLNVSNQPVDPIAERYDLVIVPRASPLPNTNMYARRFYEARFGVVAAPALAQTLSAARPDQLAGAPAVGWSLHGETSWKIHTDDNRSEAVLRVNMRFSSDHLLIVRDAAIAGLGIAFLPLVICRDEIKRGDLERILPDWSPPTMTFYAVYPSKRALAPAARRFIEQLAPGLRALG
jgi:DNA-binding transcriptional LysR family regulator